MSCVDVVDDGRIIEADCAEPLPLRLQSDEGVFVVYYSAIPPGNQTKNPGFVAYWNDFETEYLYIFGRLLFTPGDVAVALGSLQHDFGLDPALLASDDLGVSRLSSIPPATIDDASWRPASRELVLAVMGFAADEEGLGGIAGLDDFEIGPCLPTAGLVVPMPRPPRGASPDVVLQLAVDSVGCGGGCIGPCCGVSCPSSNVCAPQYCSDGACYVSWPDGRLCPDDGKYCTANFCYHGECIHPGITGVSCPSDGDPCTTDVCGSGPYEGICLHNPSSGAPCGDDGLECTLDECLDGHCHDPNYWNGLNCTDDGIPCTYDKCQGGVCTHPPRVGCARSTRVT